LYSGERALQAAFVIYYLPVDVGKGFLPPFFWDVRVVALGGSLDEVLVVSWCHCHNAGVMFNLFGY